MGVVIDAPAPPPESFVDSSVATPVVDPRRTLDATNNSLLGGSNASSLVSPSEFSVVRKKVDRLRVLAAGGGSFEDGGAGGAGDRTASDDP